MDVLTDVKALFFNYYNRPNKTPIHLSSIQRRLEDKYTPWKIRDALNQLENAKILGSMEFQTIYAGKTHFYYSRRLVTNYLDERELLKKIKIISKHIDRYSHPRVSDVVGRHLHAMVRKELKILGFKIIDEGRVKSYKKMRWNETRHDIDILAEHYEKSITVGVEIKNSLSLMDKEEILIKIKLCKKLGIIPIFACRWLEPHKSIIFSEGGFPWQFKKQMYPIGFDKFVTEMKSRFKFPMMISSEIPEKSVRELSSWLDTMK